jgi:hypothetical protein
MMVIMEFGRKKCPPLIITICGAVSVAGWSPLEVQVKKFISSDP